MTGKITLPLHYEKTGLTEKTFRKVSKVIVTGS